MNPQPSTLNPQPQPLNPGSPSAPRGVGGSPRTPRVAGPEKPRWERDSGEDRVLDGPASEVLDGPASGEKGSKGEELDAPDSSLPV